MAKIGGNWGKKFFRSEIFTPGQAEVVAAAPRDVAFVMRALKLKRGQQLLDLCCGTGRHSLLLARRGVQVTGLDATEEYLRQARRQAGPSGNPVFLRGDMRRLKYRSKFDAAVNLWTSFGYFLDPRDDLRTLKGVARALKPGGVFLIDIVSAAWLRKRAIPRNWERRLDGSYRLEELVMREGRDPGHFNTWTILSPGKRPVSASFFVRNYDYPRLAALLKKAGLTPIKRWGHFDGSPFGPESKRLIVLSRKSE